MSIIVGMNRVALSSRVAVIGAGIAGATCARALSLSGCEVHIVDKSRGAGGRLATRRLEWLDEQGRRRIVKVDHGAPAFAARGADFRQFLATASQPGTLVQWRPTLAAGSRQAPDHFISNILEAWGIFDHGIGDPPHRLDEARNRYFRIDQGAPFAHRTVLRYLDNADLGDAVARWCCPGRLEIDKGEG